MNVDRSGLECLRRDDCLELLSTTGIGRIAIHSDALPMILPVAFALDEQGIVMRIGAGSQLDRATRDAVVAFEADDVDPTRGTAWSVAVTGVVSDITDADELEVARALGLDSWAVDADDRFVRISPDLISGRRAVPVVSKAGPEELDAQGAPGPRPWRNPTPARCCSSATRGTRSRTWRLRLAARDTPWMTAAEADTSGDSEQAIAAALAKIARAG